MLLFLEAERRRVRELNEANESETRNSHNRANRGISMIEYNIL